MHHRSLIMAIAACLSLAPTTHAGACAIDGKPSAYADNVRAVIAPAPTKATWAWWAHFVFPRTYHVGQAIAFHEDDAQLRKVLRPDWWKRPWRWRFSDGRPVVGDRATHTFRHAGHYRVYVDAYVPGYAWQPFDTITINVAS